MVRLLGFVPISHSRSLGCVCCSKFTATRCTVHVRRAAPDCRRVIDLLVLLWQLIHTSSKFRGLGHINLQDVFYLLRVEIISLVHLNRYKRTVIIGLFRDFFSIFTGASAGEAASTIAPYKR